MRQNWLFMPVRISFSSWHLFSCCVFYIYFMCMGTNSPVLILFFLPYAANIRRVSSFEALQSATRCEIVPFWLWAVKNLNILLLDSADNTCKDRLWNMFSHNISKCIHEFIPMKMLMVLYLWGNDNYAFWSIYWNDSDLFKWTEYAARVFGSTSWCHP